MKRKENNLRKRLSSAMAIIAAMFVFVFSVSGAYSDKYGNYKNFTKTMKAVNVNTEIGHLKKTFSEKNYSQIKLKQKSTVNKMNVWVMNSEKKWMSDKVEIVPNDNDKIKIPYAKGVTFNKDAEVYLWGEQGNVRQLVAELTFYAQ